MPKLRITTFNVGWAGLGQTRGGVKLASPAFFHNDLDRYKLHFVSNKLGYHMTDNVHSTIPISMTYSILFLQRIVLPWNDLLSYVVATEATEKFKPVI